jgi:hypothetical protein
MKNQLTLLRAAAIALATATGYAGTFTSDFSNPAQAGITLTTGVRANGDPSPAIANGVLALTYAEGSLQGSAFLDELDPGQAVGAFNLNFKLRIGGGDSTPADGLSIYFGPEALTEPFGEEGPTDATGLVVIFDIFDNGGGEAPAIDIKYGGNIFAHAPFTVGNIQSDTFTTVSIVLKPNGTLDLSYKGQPVYSNLFIPGFTPAAGKFAFGARTGGANANHWIDDLSVTTTVAGAPVAPTVGTEPLSQTVNERATVSFTSLPSGTPPFEIQWLRNGSAITDATNLTYTVTDVPGSLTGSKYSVKFTNPVGSVTSTEATLTVNADVVAPTIVSVKGSESFTSATVTFSEAVSAATAGNAANYNLGGLSISGVTILSPTSVRLSTGTQTAGSRYTLTVNNIADVASVPNLIAAGSTKEFGAFVLAKGFLKFEGYTGIATVAVQALLDDPKYQAGTPDIAGFVSPFDSRAILPTDATENYGAVISGFFTPAESGNYTFFSRSDDASKLFLSSDANPANLAQIAEEAGCCNGFLEPPAAQTSEAIALTAGKPYYIQLIYKEGGGGDYGQVAVRKEGDPTASGNLTPIAGRFLSTYADPDVATVTVTTQPASITGAENTTVSFTAAGTGTPAPIAYQWQRAAAGSATFTDIPGATGTTYTTPILNQAADNGAKFRAVISVPGKSILTAEATLTVIIDSTPPTVAKASGGDNFKSVTVTFSENLQPAGVATAANYTIAGLTVTSATVLDAKTVRLVTSEQAQGQPYTVTVTTVKDAAGNSIVAPGNTANFTSLVFLSGVLKFEAFTGIGGGVLSDLRANAKFPGSPDSVRLVPTYEVSGFGDNYGARIKGFFIPPTTGEYLAYMASDDQGELYVSTDDSEANKKLVAVESVWANGREWVTEGSADRRPDTSKIDQAQTAPNVSLPLNLVAGRKYYTELLFKEGGGGDHGAAKFVLSSEQPPANGSDPAAGTTIGTAIEPAVLAQLALPLEIRSDLGSATVPGFKARINQANRIGDVNLPNFSWRAEQQLAGYADTNAANLSTAVNGIFPISSVINWNQDAAGIGAEAGNFTADSTPAFPDSAIPGIPGIGKESSATDNVAGEIVTYVEFPTAGIYTMGVTSDDGFTVEAGDQPPVDNLGVIATSGATTLSIFGAWSGTDAGGAFRPYSAPIEGKLVLADPILADAPIKNVDAIRGNIAVIDRGVNTFSAKVQFAKDAGAIAVVLVNSRDPDSANGKYPIVAGGVFVDLPCTMISKPQGAELKALMATGETTVKIKADGSKKLAFNNGVANQSFVFKIDQAGVYPLRLVWFEGGGGAHLEWYSFDDQGTRVLLNDRSNPKALKAFQTRAFVPPVNPEVTGVVEGSNLKLTFKGKLQSSDSLTGTYTDTGATSPHSVPLGSSAGNKFYRAAR